MVEFVARCLYCQQVEVECKKIGGLLQSILISKWKWEFISMDFITCFPRTSRQHDSTMVVVSGLDNITHFIPVKSTNPASHVSQIFIRDIMRLNGVPKKIIVDKDAKFTSRFWKDLFASLVI